jgi:hypothetical protein
MNMTSEIQVQSDILSSYLEVTIEPLLLEYDFLRLTFCFHSTIIVMTCLGKSAKAIHIRCATLKPHDMCFFANHELPSSHIVQLHIAFHQQRV